MGRQMEMGVEYKIEYNGTYDIIFKKLFQKSEIAARVIESILDCKINPSDIKYIDSVQSNGVNCKSETFDITIEIIGDNYKYIDLEMQNRIRDYEIADRLMTNLSALITNNTEKGEVYGSTKYYTICFINYPLESDECINTLFKDVSFGVKFSQIYIVDLTKIKSCDKLKLKEILEIVRSSSLKLKGSEDEVIQMAVETLYELNQDKVIRNQLRLQEKAERDRISQEKASKAKAMTEGLAEGHAKGLAEGLAEGHAKGLAEGQMIAKKEIIKSLSANGFTASQISKMLNINEDFVEALLK